MQKVGESAKLTCTVAEVEWNKAPLLVVKHVKRQLKN